METTIIAPSTMAQCLNAQLVLRNEVELVEDEDGNIAEVVTPVHAKVGEVIDVSEWHDVGSYINRGWLRLLSSVEADMLTKQQAQATPTKTDTKTTKDKG